MDKMFIKGLNGEITLYDDHLIIKKTGLFGNRQKTIYLSNMIGVNVKGLGLTRRNISIVTAEDKNERTFISQDENTILLKNNQGEEAEAFRETIYHMESKLEKVNSSTFSETDELIKFNALLNSGVITKEELEAMKKQLFHL